MRKEAQILSEYLNLEDLEEQLHQAKNYTEQDSIQKQTIEVLTEAVVLSKMAVEGISRREAEEEVAARV